MSTCISNNISEIKDESIYRQCLALESVAQGICTEIEDKLRIILEGCGGEFGLDCSDKIITAPASWFAEYSTGYFTSIYLNADKRLCAMTNEEIEYAIDELDVIYHINLWQQCEFTKTTLE